MDVLYSRMRPPDRKRARALPAKGKRELIFLFSLMGGQRDWLVDNMKWILKDNGGDIIASWLFQYIYDPMGYAEPLDDSVWEGCLADYCGKRDEILDEWRGMGHEDRKDCTGNRFRQGELDL